MGWTWFHSEICNTSKHNSLLSNNDLKSWDILVSLKKTIDEVKGYNSKSLSNLAVDPIVWLESNVWRPKL